MAWRSAAAAVLLVGPLAFLELRYATAATFPCALFAVLGGLPFSAVLVGAPAFATGDGRIWLPLRAGFVLAVSVVWFQIVRDQWPCFWGVPNCD